MKLQLPPSIEAVQWFKNGDHPEDDTFRPFEDTGKIPTEPREGKVVRYYCHPNVSGSQTCNLCFKPMKDHGWIDSGANGHMVCPSDWIVKLSDGVFISVRSYIFTDFCKLIDAQQKNS